VSSLTPSLSPLTQFPWMSPFFLALNKYDPLILSEEITPLPIQKSQTWLKQKHHNLVFQYAHCITNVSQIDWCSIPPPFSSPKNLELRFQMGEVRRVSKSVNKWDYMMYFNVVSSRAIFILYIEKHQYISDFYLVHIVLCLACSNWTNFATKS